MRNTRSNLLSLAATFALSLATLVPATTAKADHDRYRGNGHVPAVRYESRDYGRGGWGHRAPYPYRNPAPYRYDGARWAFGFRAAPGYVAYPGYPGWSPERLWVEGRWVLPPWPGAVWRAGFYSPRGLWVTGCWR